MNFKEILILCYFIIHSVFSFAQTKNDLTYRKVEFGTELQAYPVGFITTITSTIFVKENVAIRFRIGGNFANRKDFSGLNDDEKASGFGGSIGLLKYFYYKKGNIIMGANVDGWNMWTHWKDAINTLNPQQGTTYTLVVQPGVNAGYLYDVSKKLNIGLTLGIGKEINVITKGEDVGQGWIGSLSLITNYSF
jgi:hypothetical protein